MTIEIAITAAKAATSGAAVVVMVVVMTAMLIRAQAEEAMMMVEEGIHQGVTTDPIPAVIEGQGRSHCGADGFLRVDPLRASIKL